MKYFIEISVASYFTPDVVPLDWCTIIGNYVEIENDTLQQLIWFWNVFNEAMGDLCRRNSAYMDYSYDNDDPECKISTMDSMDSMVLTTEPTYTHDLTNNPPHCLDSDNI